MTKVKNSVNF